MVTRCVATNGDSMKKRLALLILMILVLSIALVACNKTEATDIAPRWQRNEEFTYNITKADFESQRDVAMNGELLHSLNELDEIEPKNICGTYTMKIARSSTNLSSTFVWTVTTEQVLFAQYAKTDLDPLSDEDLQPVLVADATMFGEIEGVETVVLRSTSHTEVQFENTPNQTPIYSKMEMHGFYVGRKHKEVSGYTVETKYDFSGKRPTASGTITIDGEQPTTFDKKFNKNASFIDSNQLLTYVRSIDKPTDGFKDRPSVQVFNPYTQETATVSFTLTNKFKALLTDSSKGDPIKANVDHVAVAIGGTYYMQQLNVPNLLSKDVDTLHENTDKPMFTTVRFRIGYISYELAQYDTDIWNALAPAVEPDKDEDDTNSGTPEDNTGTTPEDSGANDSTTQD